MLDVVGLVVDAKTVERVERAGLTVRDVRYAHFLRQFNTDRIARERHIWKNLQATGDPPRPLPPAHDKAQAWQHLLRSLPASQRERYDSVGIVAERPN